jgi:hypothetical protein
VDGEGCFALKFRRDIRRERKRTPIYFYWDIEFAILLREDDSDILTKIQDTLKCGKISHAKRGFARYAVSSVLDLSDKIVPFFEKYTLRAKKAKDFALWKEAVKIFLRNQRRDLNRVPGERGFSKTLWKDDDLRKLAGIHNEMKEYKSKGNEWKWIHKVNRTGHC